MLGTVAERIYFEKLFKVSIQYIFTVSEGELRTRGEHVTRNKYADMDVSSRLTTTFISCEAMFKLYLKGSKIIAHSDKTAKDIYNVIGDYLLDWKHFTMRRVNSHIPFENLIALDEFAESCFAGAIDEFKTTPPPLVGIEAFMQVLNQRTGFVTPNQVKDYKVERENFGQFFRAYLNQSPLVRSSWE